MLLRRFGYLLSVCPLFLAGQNQLYFEDFSGQNNFGALGQLTGFPSINLGSATWTIDVSQAQLTANSDWFVVRNEKLEGRDLDGEVFWYSPLIPINGYPGIEIKLDAEEQGTMELSDYLITEYRVDGGAWTILQENGSLIDDFTALGPNHFGIQGQNLELRVRFLNNASTEYHSIDNIEVLGYSELLYSAGQWNRSPDIYSDSMNVRVPANESISFNADVHLKNLSLSTNAQLTIESLATLTVHGAIENQGQLIVKNNGSLVQGSLTDLNTGSGLYEVQRSYVAPDHERFSFWASPVQAAQMQNVFSSTFSGDRYSFDAATQNYQAYPNGSLLPGLGYTCAPSAQVSSQITNFTDQRVFSGTLNNGDISLVFNNIAGGDWLLLGNPYASPIDFQLWLQDNQDIVSSLYLWDSSTPLKTGAAYAYWNSLGGVSVPYSTRSTPSKSIGIAQGFMVQIDPSFSGNSINIEFKNNHRISGQPSFYKNELPNQDFHLSIKKGGMGLSSLITLRENASAETFTLQKSSASGMEFFTLNGNSKCVIQAVDQPQVDSFSKLKLGIRLPDSGLCYLYLDSISGPQSFACFLFDLRDSSYHDLTDGPKVLNLRADVLDTSLEVHFFHHDLSLFANTSSLRQDDIYWFFSEGFIEIQSPMESERLKSIRLYGMEGSCLYTYTNLEGFMHHRIDRNRLVKSPYLLLTISTTENRLKVFKIPFHPN